MTSRAHRAYADTQRETSVSSAKPVELVVMVYQRLLDHLHTGKVQMSEGNDSSVSRWRQGLSRQRRVAVLR